MHISQLFQVDMKATLHGGNFHTVMILRICFFKMPLRPKINKLSHMYKNVQTYFYLFLE